MLKVEAKNQTSNVEGGKGHAGNQATPPNQPKKTRVKRWDVTGAPGLQFNDAGVFYRSRHLISLSGKHGHLIDPGKNYGGPVPPAYGGLWTGAYLRDPDDDREDDDAALIVERCRRAADLVAYECLGPPPGGWAECWAIPLDGNSGQCVPGNLRWSNPQRHNKIKHLMVSDTVASQMFNRQSRGGLYRPHRKGEYPEIFAHEQLEAPLRHRMVQLPPNRAKDWQPNGSPAARSTN
jgi:hypothetical protein